MDTFADCVTDLLLGASCPGCDRPGRGVCPGCAAELAGGVVRFAGRDPAPPGFPLTVCAGEYHGVLRRLIIGFKDEAVLGLAGALGSRLRLAIAYLVASMGLPGQAYCLVPVPSTPAAVRRRGLNHTAVLAGRAAAELRRDVTWCPAVRRVVRVRGEGTDQVGLDAAGRWRNRCHHFRASPLPGGLTAILVDDVATTGATLAAGAMALERAGSPVLGAAVVAATVRRTPPRGARR